MLDVIIVGAGIAGISLAEALRAKGLRYHLIADDSQRSTWVAGGLFNPIILKRYSLAWQAPHQSFFFRPFYETLEQRLQVRLLYDCPVLRLMAHPDEPELWNRKVQDSPCSSFMSSSLEFHNIPGVHAPYGYGKVLNSGFVDTQTLMHAYWQEAKNNFNLTYGCFQYDLLTPDPEGWSYKGMKARHIVFCEGYGMKNNPFFHYLPLQGSKGEVLLLKSATHLSHVVSGPVFMMPNHGMLRVGSTYQHHFHDANPTKEARQQLEGQLQKFFTLPYTVEEHWAAIRPTVSDRRPLLGQHPVHKGLWVYNGLGTRGILLAPALAQHLVAHMYANQPLEPDLAIARFPLSN